MSLSPTVLVLRDSKVHVGSTNSCDVVVYVKVPINKQFSITSALHILYINPNNYHVQFWRYFNDIRFQY